MPGNQFRIATFNVENLFARYRFRESAPVYKSDGWSVNDTAFEIFDEATKRVTAQAVKEVNADLLCLQEVESLPVLDRFVSQFLPSMRYKHRLVIDGRDPRHIDVAVLSRWPIVAARTRRHETRPNSGTFLFSRDCLEVDVAVGNGSKPKIFTAYVQHFKSMMGGREATAARRKEQVRRVADILDERLRDESASSNFAVLGDFNDYLDSKTSLGELVNHKTVTNVVSRLPGDQQWTHFWDDEDEYRQLDYILLSRSLDERAQKPEPVIMRKGLPWAATKYDGERFPDVGEREPAASDHAPVFIDVPHAALQ